MSPSYCEALAFPIVQPLSRPARSSIVAMVVKASPSSKPSTCLLEVDQAAEWLWLC